MSGGVGAHELAGGAALSYIRKLRGLPETAAMSRDEGVGRRIGFYDGFLAAFLTAPQVAGMTKELDLVLRAAEARAEWIAHTFEGPEDEAAVAIRDCIAAVRKQAAQTEVLTFSLPSAEETTAIARNVRESSSEAVGALILGLEFIHFLKREETPLVIGW